MCLHDTYTFHYFLQRLPVATCWMSDCTWDGFGVVNTLRPKQNGRHFADDIFKCIFLNENVIIPIEFSLKFVPKGPFNYIPTLVQIMAWRRPGDKPLSEPMMVRLLTHICVTRPQCVNTRLAKPPLKFQWEFTLFLSWINSLRPGLNNLKTKSTFPQDD